MTRNQYALGIDIGGTKTALGIVDKKGHIHAQSIFPTDSSQGLDDIGRRIKATLDALLAQLRLPLPDLVGAGLGCPGPMNRQTGEIRNPHTLPGWESGSLTDAISQQIGLPVKIENDADVALLGETLAGAGQDSQHIVMLTFGTGIGGAVLSGNRIVRGVDDEHPEIGLIPVLPDQPKDYSGVPGSLESLASGTGIARAGARVGFKDCPELFSAAKQGRPEALKIVELAIRAVTLGCLTLAHTYCPERFILGGGLMDEHFELFANPIRQALSEATLLPPNRIQVVQAELGNRAGMVGAASLALKPEST